jgi:hypothetical protein
VCDQEGELAHDALGEAVLLPESAANGAAVEDGGAGDADTIHLHEGKPKQRDPAGQDIPWARVDHPDPDDVQDDGEEEHVSHSFGSRCSWGVSGVQGLSLSAENDLRLRLLVQMK